MARARELIALPGAREPKRRSGKPFSQRVQPDALSRRYCHGWNAGNLGWCGLKVAFIDQHKRPRAGPTQCLRIKRLIGLIKWSLS